MYDRVLLQQLLFEFQKTKSSATFDKILLASIPVIDNFLSKFPRFSSAFDDIRQEVLLRLWKTFRVSEAFFVHREKVLCDYLILKIREYVSYAVCKDLDNLIIGCEDEQIDYLQGFLEIQGQKLKRDLVSEFGVWMEETGEGWNKIITWLKRNKISYSRAVVSAIKVLEKVQAFSHTNVEVQDGSHHPARISGEMNPEKDLVIRELIKDMFFECVKYLDKHLNLSKNNVLYSKAKKSIENSVRTDYGICTVCWKWLDACICN